MKYFEEKGKLTVIGVSGLNLPLTLDCGQAFRWREESGVFCGVVRGRVLRIMQIGDRLELFGCSEADFHDIWFDYFDLGRDYNEICGRLSADDEMRAAVSFCPGIHILRQEPWEALCSFIISQNNNIPRIKGIVSRLCESFGEPLGDGFFAFPSAERLAPLTVEALAPLRAGFRAKYILDAAQKVAGGSVELDALSTMPLDEARKSLMTIKGVGAKVAECTLLYGCSRVEAFPVDVWVRRVMSESYPDGLPECALGVQGIAQQYLFHYRRTYKGD